MGLFDDFIGLANDIQDLKEDVRSTVSQAMTDVSSIRDEAISTVTELTDEIAATIHQQASNDGVETTIAEPEN